jgi:hypothetical protein
MVDVRSVELRSMTIPGSTPDVTLARLHVSASKATVSVVRFPAGWSRPGTGHYGCAELFVVIEGMLVVSEVPYVEGEYGYLPAGTPRTDSRCDTGCLTVAWFSGPPVWWPGISSEPVAPSAHGPVATVAAGGAYGLAQPPVQAVEVPTEMLSVATGQWCMLAPGDTPPALPGPVLVRPWGQP